MKNKLGMKTIGEVYKPEKESWEQIAKLLADHQKSLSDLAQALHDLHLSVSIIGDNLEQACVTASKIVSKLK